MKFKLKSTKLGYKRPWILVAAYDVSTGATSEGYVAINILKRLSPHYRIILITRKNNRDQLTKDPSALGFIPGIRIIGYDLPRWARWWKRGPRFYSLYAYLWQLCWPLALLPRQMLRRKLALCHVLNFHNDSIPTLGWILGPPLVWGPINHNELAPIWRQSFWPFRVRTKARFGFLLRRIAWLLDPLLQLTKHKSRVIFSAGSWVEHRLRLTNNLKVVRLSQQGVDASTFITASGNGNAKNEAAEKTILVYAGRLDWIKGLDIAIDAIALLPEKYELQIIGKGPSKNRLQCHIDKLGLSHRILINDPVERIALSTIYNESNIFFFPSSEAGGLSWVEALCCGLPVAGIRGDSLLTATSEKLSGVYVSDDLEDRITSVETLANMIRACAEQKHNPLSIRKNALDLFSWDALAGTILREYKKIESSLWP